MASPLCYGGAQSILAFVPTILVTETSIYAGTSDARIVASLDSGPHP
jgi:hypothetical protein